jgi:hypothetical protein
LSRISSILRVPVAGVEVEHRAAPALSVVSIARSAKSSLARPKV